MAKKEEVKGEMIDLTEKVTIVAKKGAKHMTPDKEYEVHPKIADHLVKKGYATLKK